MHTATQIHPMQTISNGLASTRDWLDARGKKAWIAAMVLGFIFVWPVGLGILFYMIGRKPMNIQGYKSCNRSRFGRYRSPSTGNTAFDSYRDETLRRLEEEQHAFQEFIERLREAKDKSEFDQFMDDRSKPTAKDDVEAV